MAISLKSFGTKILYAFLIRTTCAMCTINITVFKATP